MKKKMFILALMTCMILPTGSAFAATTPQPAQVKGSLPPVVCYLDAETGVEADEGVAVSQSLGKIVQEDGSVSRSVSKSYSVSDGQGKSIGVSVGTVTKEISDSTSADEAYLDSYKKGYTEGFSDGFLKGLLKAKEILLEKGSLHNKSRTTYPCTKPITPNHPNKVKPQPLPYYPDRDPALLQPLREK